MLDELQEHVESIDMANGKFLHSFVRFLFCDDIFVDSVVCIGGT